MWSPRIASTDKTYHTHLLRRSVREGGRVRKETLAYLPD
jgi:hypothetical protein